MLTLFLLALPQIDLPQFDLPQFDLPQLGLTDSLESLANFANQLQILVTTAIAHPLWAVGAIVFGVGLLQLIADLTKRVIKSTLTFVLTLPLLLSQWVWKRATTTQASTASASKKERINQLVERLDQLRLEQAQTVAELKTMLADSEAIAPSQIAKSTPLAQREDIQIEESKDAITPSP